MAKENQSAGLAHNSLTPDTVINGNVSAPTDIRIDGQVNGNIECKGKVIIGETGKVKGNVCALNADIMGNLEGDLQVAETLVLKSTAIMQGNIITGTLVIEPKATLNGKCEMILR